jgi:hypothetical protein
MNLTLTVCKYYLRFELSVQFILGESERQKKGKEEISLMRREFNTNEIFHPTSDGRTETIAQRGKRLLMDMPMTIQTRQTFSFPHRLEAHEMMMGNKIIRYPFSCL